jgi:hypothetical protein
MSTSSPAPASTTSLESRPLASNGSPAPPSIDSLGSRPLASIDEHELARARVDRQARGRARPRQRQVWNRGRSRRSMTHELARARVNDKSGIAGAGVDR